MIDWLMSSSLRPVRPVSAGQRRAESRLLAPLVVAMGVACAMTMTSAAAEAQSGDGDDGEGGGPAVPLLGGFLGFQPGFGVGALTGFEPVSDVNALGTGAELNSRQLHIGGAGRLFTGPFMFGASAFGIFTPGAQTDRGTAEIDGSALSVVLGYGIFGDNSVFYPYLGMGAGALNMRLTNDTNGDISFGESELADGQSRRYRAEYVFLDAGVGLAWSIPNLSFGAVIGFEIGAHVVISDPVWRSDNIEVGGAGTPGFSNLALRLTIGVGGLVQDEPVF